MLPSLSWIRSINFGFTSLPPLTNEQYAEVNFKSVNVLSNQNIREGIKKFSEWPTVPQLYVKKEFVGGCDIIKEMFENGELKKLLEDKQIQYKK